MKTKKILSVCRDRSSVRSYKQDPIPEDIMEYIKECVRLAPSAVNFQPWRFIIVKDENKRQKLQQCYQREWFKEAPCYIIACCVKNEAWIRKQDAKNHGDIDLAIAIEHLCLAAAEQGLGTCWVCNFDVSLFAKGFSLPEDWEPIALIPIGYPADDTSETKEKNRKATQEIWLE